MCAVLLIREQHLILHLKKPNNKDNFVYFMFKDLLMLPELETLADYNN